jgi:hypothetical protein
MANCKACGEEIKWIRTRAGKLMPVDPELETLPLAPGITVVTAQGDVLRGSLATCETRAQGFTPHWQTCTHPSQFRKPRG